MVVGDVLENYSPTAESSESACRVIPQQCDALSSSCTSNSTSTSSRSSRCHRIRHLKISRSMVAEYSACVLPSLEYVTFACMQRGKKMCTVSKAALCIAVVGVLLWVDGARPRVVSCLSFSAHAFSAEQSSEDRVHVTGERVKAAASAERGRERNEGIINRGRERQGGPCSTLATCRTETDALLLLQQHSANAQQQQQPQQQQQQSEGGTQHQERHYQAEKDGDQHSRQHRSEQQSPSAEDLDTDVEIALRRGWWAAAREVILASHRTGVDISSMVRRTVQEIRDELDETLRLLDKRYYEIQVVPPAFQWAQSPEEIFLNVKFAYRWSSPGALSVSDPSFHSEARRFSFSGVGLHSGVQKKYSLTLSLYSDIDPDLFVWRRGPAHKKDKAKGLRGAGVFSLNRTPEIQFIITHAGPVLYKRTLCMQAKISNMNVWWDMKEKYQKELDEFLKDKDNKTTESTKKSAANNASNSDSNKASTNSSKSNNGGAHSVNSHKGAAAAAPNHMAGKPNGITSEATTGRSEEL